MIVSTRRLRLIQMRTTKSWKGKIKKKGLAMTTDFLVLVDWSRGMWIVQHLDPSGTLIIESTDFPACTPSIVVCDRLLKDRPGSRVFAKISENDLSNSRNVISS